MNHPTFQKNKFLSIKDYFRKVVFVFLNVLFYFTSYSTSFAQEKNTAGFFPNKVLFKPLLFDPIEAQSYGYFTRKRTEGHSDSGLYAPFSFGFNKPIYQWSETKQLNMDATVFTQFDMFNENGKFRRYMRNADYKISLSYNWQKKTGSLG